MGTAIKPPYVVKAIGNPQELSNAVTSPGEWVPSCRSSMELMLMSKPPITSLLMKCVKLRKISMQRR